MTLAADYLDKKGCPHCGAPLRRIGRWFVSQGEWRFEPQAISGKRVVEGDRPTYHPERWTSFQTERTILDPKTNVEKRMRVTEWHWLAEFECMGTLHGQKPREYECPLIQECDAIAYTGPEFDWMQPPTRPDLRPVDLSAIVDRKRASAGDAS